MSDITHVIQDMKLDERGHKLLYGASDESKLMKASIMTSGDVRYVSTISGVTSCGNCGEYVGIEWVDEENVRAKTECEYSHGITTVVYINVPSGKIVVNDSLRDAYNFDDDDLPSYNSTLGQHMYIKRMAELGCAYGPVLNTSPSMYEVSPGRYVLASPAFNENEDEDAEDDGEFLPLSMGGKEVASVCTDLWAYSIADYDDYVSKGGELERKWGSPTVVEVPPGRYRLTHHTGEEGFDYHSADEVIFGEFERVGLL